MISDSDWLTVGAAIRLARKERGFNQAELGAMLGVSGAAVSNWENGKDLNFERLVDIGRHLRLNIELPWWVSSDLREVPLSAAPGYRHLIPKFDQDKVLEPDTREFTTYTGHHFDCSNSSYAMVVQDRSNSPEIEPGDIVVIDPGLRPRPEDMVLAHLAEGVVLRKLRIVQLAEERYFELVPLNSSWPVERLADSAARYLLGVVTELAKPRK